MRMQGAYSLDAAMQLSERYDATSSKQQHSPDLQNASQKQKKRNPGPNDQSKSTKNGKPH